MAEQGPEQTTQIERPTKTQDDVIRYIDKKIEREQTLWDRYVVKKSARPPEFSEEKNRQRVKQLEVIKKAVSERGEYRGVIPEIAKDLEKARQELSELQKDKTLYADAEEYYRLEAIANKGRELLSKVSDPEAKQWMTDRLPELHERMGETEKGKAEQTKRGQEGRIRELEGLHRFTSSQPLPS